MEKASSKKQNRQESKSHSKDSIKKSMASTYINNQGKTLDPKKTEECDKSNEKKIRTHASELIRKQETDATTVSIQKDALLSIEKHRTAKSVDPSDQATEGKFVSPSVVDEKNEKRKKLDDLTIVDGKSWVIKQKANENANLSEVFEKDEN